MFILAVAAIIVAVYLVVLLALGTGFGAYPGLDPVLFGIVAVGTGLLIGGGSAFRWVQLRKGGPAVASLMGGRRVEPNTRDADERRLVNVVEEMALASGIPVPAIFVMDQESSINAFAAGTGIHDAAVGVTRGTIENLDRDELQGVVAHEFSHILNGDMRLNVRLIGLLFGILLLAVVGRGLMRGAFWGRRRDRDARAALVGLALVALGYIGVFFGKLIKAAVSRQREFLADAAAVQFTRNPLGIAGALKKIGAHPVGARIEDHHAEEMSHLFFANGLRSSMSPLTSTHPPLTERIHRIDPSWDGSFPELPDPSDRDRASRRVGAEQKAGAPGGGRKAPFPFGLPEGVVGSGGGAGAGATLGAAAVLLEAVGAPTPEHVGYARELLERIPRRVLDAAHEPEGARALVLCLLGGEHEASRKARRDGARSLAEDAPSLIERVEALEPIVAELPAEARLPLLDLAVPSLDRVPTDAAARLRTAAERVIRADGRIRPFDFCVMHILWRHLPGSPERPKDRARGPKALGDVPGDLEALLSVVARTGAASEDAAEQAFQAGVQTLGGVGRSLTFRSEEEVGMARLDEALQRLEGGTLDVRRGALQATAAVVFADERLRAEELELLRAVAECLEIPIPPLLARPG